MNLRLSGTAKIGLVVLAFIISVLGFMVKLPSSFRHHDKELHALFYFLAAAFLNVLFTRGRLWVHALLFGALYLFGLAIEYSQEYSNQFFRVKIHGRFDPEDVKWNTIGLVAFSGLWILVTLVQWGMKKSKSLPGQTSDQS